MTSLWPIQWHDTVDSTNLEAKRLVDRGVFSNQWIAARMQTAGRGRFQRDWKSPRGNLFASALYIEPDGLKAALRVPFVSAIAVADTVNTLIGQSVSKLKWPNDVRVNRQKISGILVESGQLDNGAWVVSGIGINVQTAPEGAGQAATSIAAERGDDILTVDDVLPVLCEQFQLRLEEARQDFNKTLKTWQAIAESLGDEVEVRTQKETISGIFEGLDDDGGLILSLPDGQTRIIRTGDVNLVGGPS